MLHHIVQKCSTPHSRMLATHDTGLVICSANQVLFVSQTVAFQNVDNFLTKPCCIEIVCGFQMEKTFLYRSIVVVVSTREVFSFFFTPFVSSAMIGASHLFNVLTSHPNTFKDSSFHTPHLCLSFFFFRRFKDHWGFRFYLYESLLAHLNWLNGHPANICDWLDDHIWSTYPSKPLVYLYRDTPGTYLCFVHACSRPLQGNLNALRTFRFISATAQVYGLRGKGGGGDLAFPIF